MGSIRDIFRCGFVLIILIFVLRSSDAKVVTVDVRAARDLINQGHLFVDVRTEEEFKNGHLVSAFNIPYMFNTSKGMLKNPDFMDRIVSLYGKEDRIVLGCRSGVRSLNAATDLVTAEFKHVYNMGGGYNAWIQKGFEVHKPHIDEL